MSRSFCIKLARNHYMHVFHTILIFNCPHRWLLPERVGFCGVGRCDASVWWLATQQSSSCCIVGRGAGQRCVPVLLVKLTSAATTAVGSGGGGRMRGGDWRSHTVGSAAQCSAVRCAAVWRSESPHRHDRWTSAVNCTSRASSNTARGRTRTAQPRRAVRQAAHCGHCARRHASQPASASRLC